MMPREISPVQRLLAVAVVAVLLSLVTLANRMGVDHAAPGSAIEQAALDVVARRTAAYNSHDIDAFIATYDNDVRVYEFPDTLLGTGTERMRRIFGPQFGDDDGLTIVHAQHALGNIVVSDETVTFYGNTEHNIGVYTIEDGSIVEVRLIEPAE